MDDPARHPDPDGARNPYRPAPFPGREPEGPVLSMSFGDHLDELRRRLIFALVGTVPIFAASLVVGRPILDFLIRPVRAELRAAGQPTALMATGPFETFGAFIRISLVLTVIVGSPWVLYQLWKFISPGLYKSEKRFVYLLLPLSTALTCAGVAFLYLVILPVVLAFFMGFGSTVGGETPRVAPPPAGIVFPTVPVLDADPPNPGAGEEWINRELMQRRVNVGPEGGPPLIYGTDLVRGTGVLQQYRISEYIRVVLNMAFAFAIGFQLPVVILLLGWSGLVDREWFKGKRRIAIAFLFVASAILTPADPMSLILLAIPLCGLYEFGLLLLRIFPPRPFVEMAGTGDDEGRGPDDAG